METADDKESGVTENPFMHLLGDRPTPNLFTAEWSRLVDSVFAWTYATEAVVRAEKALAQVKVDFDADTETIQDELRHERQKRDDLEELLHVWDTPLTRDLFGQKQRSVKALEYRLSASEQTRRINWRLRDAQAALSRAHARLTKVTQGLEDACERRRQQAA